MPEPGEQPNVYQPETGGNAGKWILLALAIVYVGATLFFGHDMHTRLTQLTDDSAASQKKIADLTKRMQSAESDAEALGEKIGVTKKEMTERAEELQRQQQAAAVRSAAQTAELKKDVGAVAGEVGSVRSDVGPDRSDFARDCAYVFFQFCRLGRAPHGGGLLLALQLLGALRHFLLRHTNLLAQSFGVGFRRLHALGQVGDLLLAGG